MAGAGKQARVAAWDFSTLLPLPLRSNRESQKKCETRLARQRCYHHIEMKPHSIGRVLGIGLRVAGRLAGQHMAGGARNAATQTAATPPAAQAFDEAGANKRADKRAAGRAAGQASRGLARGVGGFLRPFRQVGGTLWLEVTGAFFFLFVLIFARAMWRVRASYALGPDHLRFLGYAAVAAVFLYLTVSSFWRARKR